MTAAAFADLVRARPAGRGRWQARCPAHRDRSPSLAVTEGAEGRVLLRCWAGCGTEAVLAALGLTMRDLFNSAPVSPRARAEARRLKAEREAEEREQARAERRANTLYRRLVCVADALGSRLARLPDGAEADALMPVCHAACRMRDEAEAALGIGPEAPADGCARPLACPPFTALDPERAEARRVRTEAELRCYAGTGQAGPVLALRPERARPSIWSWTPARPADTELNGALHTAALGTLEEFEALLGLRAPHTNQSPVVSGALMEGAA